MSQPARPLVLPPNRSVFAGFWGNRYHEQKIHDDYGAGQYWDVPADALSPPCAAWDPRSGVRVFD
jgi:hypothetical protein